MRKQDYNMSSLVFVQNLGEGEVYKNYKELCKILNEPELKGNSKKAQIKEWERYFEYEKVGQKYIITEIYNEPLPKVDGRIYNGDKQYIECIEYILLDYLSHQEGKSTSLTIKYLFYLLGMVNHNYIDKKYKIEDDDILDWEVKHFNQRVYKKLNKILFNALRNLTNRRLIDYQKVKMINIDEYIDNNKYKTNVVRPATNKEIDYIRETEHIILNEMGFESIVLVHLKYKTDEFYKKVQDILMEKYDINYYYSSIDLRFTPEHIEIAKDKMANKVLEHKKDMNNKIIASINQEAETKLKNNKEYIQEQYEKMIDDIIGKPNSMVTKRWFDYERERDAGAYLYSQRKLTEYLIEIGDNHEKRIE